MKLIILNGPCGIGKSTLAARVHDALPLSFLVDVDAQTRNISHYREFDRERWELAFAVSLSIIEACLKLGRSVIIDKMTYQPEILDAYHELGRRYGAEVHEIILWAPKDVVMSRAHARGFKEGGSLTPEKCERFWDEIDRIKAQRKEAIVVDVTKMDEEEVMKKVMEMLG